VIKSIKIPIAICFALFSLPAFAQRLSGIVVDRNTLLPIAHTTISIPSQTIFTSVTGQFTFTNIHKSDTVKVTCIGYKPHYLVYDQPVSDTIRIYLEPGAIALKSVVITGRRDPKADSIRLRKEFAPVFEHKNATIKDAFITRDPYVYKPNDYITSTNNATTLISVNLLSVLDLLNKNNAHVSKLQKTLLKEEEYDFVDRKFSKQKVTEITRLKGDSLQTFMDKYRPSATDARKMTDYDVMIYIKKYYAEFTQPAQQKKKKQKRHDP
jgi:hypothetical protein